MSFRLTKRCTICAKRMLWFQGFVQSTSYFKGGRRVKTAPSVVCSRACGDVAYEQAGQGSHRDVVIAQ